MSAGGGGVSLLHELMGLMRRSLTQQAPIREALYQVIHPHKCIWSMSFVGKTRCTSVYAISEAKLCLRHEQQLCKAIWHAQHPVSLHTLPIESSARDIWRSRTQHVSEDQSTCLLAEKDFEQSIRGFWWCKTCRTVMKFSAGPSMPELELELLLLLPFLKLSVVVMQC